MGSNETKNEPKSLGEMTKEELLRRFLGEAHDEYLHDSYSGVYYQLRAEILRRIEAAEALAKWKKSAMTLLPLQEWGTTLGLVVGESIHDKILPALQELAQLRQERDAASVKSEDIEKLWTAVSKLESQVCRNPDLPEVYKSIVADAFAVLDAIKNRAESAERKPPSANLQEQAEAVRQLLRYCSHLISCSYSEDFPCNCGFNATAERLKALQPTPEGGKD